MNVKVVLASGKELEYENATLHVYSYKKLHIMEKRPDENGLLRIQEHGFTDDAWKEVHVYNDPNLPTYQIVH